MDDHLDFRRLSCNLWLMVGFILLCIFNNCLIQSYQFESDPQEYPEYGNPLAYTADEANDRLARKVQPKIHEHRSPQEEFQCVETKKANSGEGNGGEIDETCHDEKKKMILASVGKLGCSRLTMKVVKLKPPGPNFELLPSVALVQRCGGHCNGPKICKPKTTKKITIPVFQIDQTTRERTCVNYELEEHVDCQCGCAIESHHCTQHQTYHPHHCFCACDNYEERESCNEMSKMTERFWDDASCKCLCNTQTCSAPAVWVPYLCKCARLSPEDEMGNML